MVQCSTNTSCISQVPTRNFQDSTKRYILVFLRDEEFVSKTINDSNIDLNKFPATKVRKLSKKIESSKATAKHIKQAASNPQAAQINLMCHKCTELPPSKFKRRQKKLFRSRQDTNKQYYNKEKQRERMP